jgi:chromosome segregation ATPase
VDRQVIQQNIAALGDFDDNISNAQGRYDAARRERQSLEKILQDLTNSHQKKNRRADNISSEDLPNALDRRNKKNREGSEAENSRAAWESKARSYERTWRQRKDAYEGARTSLRECRAAEERAAERRRLACQKASSGTGTGTGTGSGSGTGTGTGTSSVGTGTGTGGSSYGTGTGSGTGSGTGTGGTGSGGDCTSGTGTGTSGTGSGCSGKDNRVRSAHRSLNEAEEAYSDASANARFLAKRRDEAYSDANYYQNKAASLEAELRTLEAELPRIASRIQETERNLEQARNAEAQAKEQLAQLEQGRKDRAPEIEAYRSFYLSKVQEITSQVPGFEGVFGAVEGLWFLKLYSQDREISERKGQPLIEQIKVTVRGDRGWKKPAQLTSLVAEDFQSLVSADFQAFEAATQALASDQQTLAQLEKDLQSLYSDYESRSQAVNQAERRLSKAKAEKKAAGWGITFNRKKKARRKAAKAELRAAESALSTAKSARSRASNAVSSKKSQVSRQRSEVSLDQQNLEDAAQRKQAAEEFLGKVGQLDKTAFDQAMEQIANLI